MHPAISVILFSVLSGAGFGMLAIIGLDFPFRDNPANVFVISFVGVGLAVAGLVSSTFHLGRPAKAWRAFSQWRSSWLSREGIAAVATLLLYGIYALWWMIEGERLAWLGALVTIGSVLTVFTTSMIYAQMKTVPHWNTKFTPVVYLAFSLCTGFLLAAGFGINNAYGGNSVVIVAIAALLTAWAAKTFWWQRAKKSSLANSTSSTATATGLGKIGKVRLLERPHTGPNYLTKEMVHIIGRKHASRLRQIAMVIGGLLPLAIVLLIFIGLLPQGAMAAAALAMIIGLFAERWLFFAEAEHSVSLYY
ncbi:MAG: dimethyl sulfoxide reductase anchor subunit [Rhizobiaceae bacterium]|nr:dimethyl sulfoxide reductase anchor subunit [Rhizobiaceae bacterium]